MDAARILLVEDDEALAEALQDALDLADYVTVRARDGEEALQLLAGDTFHLMVSDVKMAPMDGYTLLRRARQGYPELPILLMTAWGTIQDAVAALQLGAVDYLVKPFDAELLLEKVKRHLRAPPPHSEDGVVARAPAMGAALQVARRAAQTDVSIMLLGESGVGKEVMARFIHSKSPRANGPFVAVNCAAIPETLLEATLFGHEKGAFTGATQASPGKFEQAQGGTLLLDEVTEMAPGLQAKLLRVLQERELERVGGRRRVALDLRVIATSNRDLRQAVAQGVLREDLYYRLNVFPIRIPALRERREDILPLTELFLQHYSLAHGLGRVPQLDAGARRAMLEWGWPGNVRELENVVQRMVILCDGRDIGVGDLMLEETAQHRLVPVGLEVESGLEGAMAEKERRLIADALKDSQGSKKLAAERLGISPRTLRHKLQRLREAGLEIQGA